jgi:hypothetical protein
VIHLEAFGRPTSGGHFFHQTQEQDMAPKASLSGPARKRIVGEILAGLAQLQSDGGLSFGASMGVTLLMGWLQKEYTRLVEKYPD